MQLGPQHEEMAALAGTWTVRTTMYMDPSAPPQTAEGTAVRTLILGGRVMEEVLTSNFGDQPYEGRGRSGYDNLTERFWSVWTDTMGTGLTVCYGNWNAAHDLFVMEGETPSPMTGGMTPMRIEARMDGADREIDEFFMPGPDGTMIKTMEIVYERV